MSHKIRSRSVLIALILLLVGLGYTFAQNKVVVVPLGEAGSPGGRMYYLTTSSFEGNQVLNRTTCAPGFHVASIFELINASNLSYDKTRGIVNPDQGAGPPTGNSGWVRTGAISWTGQVAGRANCSVWTSNSGADYGSAISIVTEWDNNVLTPELSPWVALTHACSFGNNVWCIQNL